VIEFDYKLDYKNILFKPNDTRYRIGRGEQGVLLVRPYTNDICKHWKFKTPYIAQQSAQKIFDLYLDYRCNKDFVGMDMCRKFLEMGFTRARRYANHKDGKKYKNGKILPQEKDALTSQKAISARIFKTYRDLCTTDEYYIQLRKKWRDNELVVSRQTSQRTA
tara:strand:- start:16 stop:504 length:489 start_codon:yes stop_codon:yes gene_type:complete